MRRQKCEWDPLSAQLCNIFIIKTELVQIKVRMFYKDVTLEWWRVTRMPQFAFCSGLKVLSEEEVWHFKSNAFHRDSDKCKPTCWLLGEKNYAQIHHYNVITLRFLVLSDGDNMELLLPNFER